MSPRQTRRRIGSLLARLRRAELDEAERSELLEELRRWLVAHLRNRAPEGRGDDVAQDVLVAVSNGLASTKPGAEVAWLKSVIVNKLADAFRKEYRWGPPLALDEAAPESFKARAYERVLVSECLEHIRSFPPVMRDCALLHFVHGLTPREIALRLGMKEATVRVHVFNARVKLKRFLGWRKDGAEHVEAQRDAR